MAGSNQRLLLPIHDALDGTALLGLRRNAAGGQLFTLLSTFEEKSLCCSRVPHDANQRQQRLHNDEPATTIVVAVTRPFPMSS